MLAAPTCQLPFFSSLSLSSPPLISSRWGARLVAALLRDELPAPSLSGPCLAGHDAVGECHSRCAAGGRASSAATNVEELVAVPSGAKLPTPFPLGEQTSAAPPTTGSPSKSGPASHGGGGGFAGLAWSSSWIGGSPWAPSPGAEFTLPTGAKADELAMVGGEELGGGGKAVEVEGKPSISVSGLSAGPMKRNKRR